MYIRYLIEQKMIVKIHKSPDGRKVVAVCDFDLLGKKFSDGKLQLDISNSFYNGEKRTEDSLAKELRRPCSVNIVGEKSIKFFVDRKLIDEKNVIRIKNIPHAQLVMVGD